MASYISDRAFTDYIHKNLAKPLIYGPLKWTQVELEKDYAEEIDQQKGIDYIFRDSQGNLRRVQERFREIKYQTYSDFTIRYRRDENIHKERRRSEYYKMKADYFTYGITNCYKRDNFSKCTGFVKFAVIDLKKVYDKIDRGDILIKDNKHAVCTLQSNKIICPVKYNKDGSSSFFPIEIAFLVRLWGDEIIVTQKGFV